SVAFTEILLRWLVAAGVPAVVILSVSALPLFVNHTPFLFGGPATPEIYTLSLHDALPISTGRYARLSIGRKGCIPGLFRERRGIDRKSTRLNSSHVAISYVVFCLKKTTPKADDSIGTITAMLVEQRRAFLVGGYVADLAVL